MGFYSGNGVKTSLSIQAILDGDTDIVKVGGPNVSQFGWTTNDLTSVRDILTYVKTAIEAAEIAQNAAEAAAADRDRIEQLDGDYQSKLQDIDTKYNTIVDLSVEIAAGNAASLAQVAAQTSIEVNKLIGIPTGASQIGTSSGSNVQSELDGIRSDISDIGISGKIPTVESLRLTEPSAIGQIINVMSYYNTPALVGGGSYRYDSEDVTSPDDGMLCIVTNNGARWKPILSDNSVTASRCGLLTGSDVTALWKKWCSLPLDKVLDGPVFVSGVGILSDSTNLLGSGKSSISLTKSVSDQVSQGNEGSCLEAGNYSRIVGIKFQGLGFNGAGVFIGSKLGVIVDSCEMSTSYAIGVKNYKSTGTKVTKCHIHGNRHGILSQQSNNTIVSGNHVHNISWTVGNNGGGIWTSSDTNILVSNNIVHDCADVGIDFEGGNNCVSDGNIVSRCRNGELTFFGTSTSLTGVPVMGRNSHKNNLVLRESFAYDKDGNQVDNELTDAAGCVIYGTLDLLQDGEISFEGNKVYSLSTSGVSLFCFRSRTSSPTSNCQISFKGNTFISNSGYMGTLLDRQDTSFEDNKIVFRGGTVRTTELRDHRTFKFRNNSVDILPGVITGNNVFSLITAISVPPGVLEFSKNKFTGYNGVWIFVDQINSGRDVVIDNNNFSDEIGYTVIPVLIGAGGIIWKNQTIKLFRPTGAAVNFAAVGALYQSSFTSIDSEAWVLLSGKLKSGYRFSLKCDKSDTMFLSAVDAGGAINTGRFPDPTSYASFSGNTVSFTTTGSLPLSSIVILKLNSTHL